MLANTLAPILCLCHLRAPARFWYLLAARTARVQKVLVCFLPCSQYCPTPGTERVNPASLMPQGEDLLAVQPSLCVYLSVSLCVVGVQGTKEGPELRPLVKRAATEMYCS